MTLTVIQGCFFFKKDLMKDDADDVEEMVIVSSGGQDYLVSKEEIFQATSKSSKGGMRMTTGYTENRLSSYNIQTGELVKRIELGERDDNYMNFLGVADGKLWYVSENEKIGLHTRDPKTLDIINSQEDITNVNPNLKNNFPKVKYYELSKYYGFNVSLKTPMVSDNSGIVYEIDPKTLKATVISESIKRFDFKKSTETTSLHFNSEKYMSLSGEPRKIFEFENKKFKDINFLDGKFLLTSNSINIAEVFPDYVKPILDKITKAQNKLDSLNNVVENAKDNNDKNYEYTKRYIDYEIRNSEDEIKRQNDDLRRINDETYTGIITRDNGVYIKHRSSASDTAKIILSKVIVDPVNHDVKLIWSTLLENIFWEPEKVYEKDGFDYVFSSGSPKLDTKRIVFKDKYLIFFTMLKTVCINMETGVVLWKVTM